MNPHAVPLRDTTLPAVDYVSTATYETERELVFGRAWQLAAFSDDVREAGSFVTATLGDREFVVVRDEALTLRAFHNICPHRGAAVVGGSGCRRTLQCPYHGWTYRLDGSLWASPASVDT